MITNWEYIRASTLAAAGTLLALVAGFALVFVWFPVINPGSYRESMHGPPRSAASYYIGTTICVVLICLGKIVSDQSLKIVGVYKEQKRKQTAANHAAQSTARTLAETGR